MLCNFHRRGGGLSAARNIQAPPTLTHYACASSFPPISLRYATQQAELWSLGSRGREGGKGGGGDMIEKCGTKHVHTVGTPLIVAGLSRQRDDTLPKHAAAAARVCDLREPEKGGEAEERGRSWKKPALSQQSGTAVSVCLSFPLTANHPTVTSRGQFCSWEGKRNEKSNGRGRG